MKCRLALVVAACAVGVSLPVAASAQSEHSHQPVPADAAVDFGVLPMGPIGPPPCLQVGAHRRSRRPVRLQAAHPHA